MSSATSIEGNAGPTDPGVAAPPAARSSDGFKPWHFFVVASLMAATAAVVIVRQPSPEHLVLLSLTIGAAGFCAAALHRTLAPLAQKNVTHERAPLSARSRAALEREKMLALRSIKELEFDRAMGKVSAADFEEMAGRLRARAISLMKQLDAGTSAYRAIIEQELAARLRTGPAARRQACACGTANDDDATFCKHCGKRLSFDSPE